MFTRSIAICLLAVLCGAASGAEGPEQLIRKALQGARAGLPIERIAAAEIPGMYRVELHGGQVLYATSDGKNFIAGDLFSIVNKQLVNMTDARRNAARRDLLKTVKLVDMVVFAPKGPVKAVVDVFTDVDCQYCQKLHSQIAEYNALGIEIRYLAYPRAGLASDTHTKLVTAWCSQNRQDAITQLKLHRQLPPRNCTNPVDAQFALGEAVGVNGTPALVLESGELVPGYVPPVELARMLGIKPS